MTKIAGAEKWLEEARGTLRRDPTSTLPCLTNHDGWNDAVSAVYSEPENYEETLLSLEIRLVLQQACRNVHARTTANGYRPTRSDLAAAFRLGDIIAKTDPNITFSMKRLLHELMTDLGFTAERSPALEW